MCGVVGFYTTDSNSGNWKKILRDMSDALHHRGPDDSVSMAEAIDNVLSSSTERARLVQYGNKRVEDFSFSNISLSLEKLYRSLL